jgi:hypothetical protein
MVPSLITASIGHCPQQFLQVTVRPAEPDMNTLPAATDSAAAMAHWDHDEAPNVKDL